MRQLKTFMRNRKKEMLWCGPCECRTLQCRRYANENCGCREARECGEITEFWAMFEEDLNSRIDEIKQWIEQAREESQEEGYDGKIFINVDDRAYRIVEPNSDSIATMEISISGCKYSFIASIDTDPEAWYSVVVIDFLD